MKGDLWWWSYALTAVGLLSWYLVGKKNIMGFVVGIIGQIMWITYGFASHQTGFKISGLLYGAFQLKAMIDWSRTK